MERQGSGFKKITEAYHAAHNFRAELEPAFYSDINSFRVTLYNLNYDASADIRKHTDENVVIEAEKVAIEAKKVAIEVAIEELNANQNTIRKVETLFAKMGTDGIFGRSDIAGITGDSLTAAGNLITKLKQAELLEPVGGCGKGKYRFRHPT